MALLLMYLDRAKAAGDVSCKFHDGTFTISCLRNDNTSLYQFVKLVGDFIATESEKEADVFEVSEGIQSRSVFSY